MRSMADWLFTWKGILPGAVILVGVVALGIALREGTLGNIASIVGLAVSVFGFVITIWTVLDARRQIEEAGDRPRKPLFRQERKRAVRWEELLSSFWPRIVLFF